MDTNRNDGQNYQINTFNKGMNTDTALDAVGEGQYIFGQNIRISNNVLLTGNIDPNSKEGLVTPITIGEETTLIDLENVDRILATGSIGNIGVVIVRYIEDPIVEPVARKWAVYKVVKNDDGLTPTRLYASTSTTTKNKFSIVLNKEQEDIIKLYIADGDHGIMQLFVEGGANPNYQGYTDDDLVSGKYFPSDKAIIVGTTSGRLKTSQVQYTYRFYKRFGVFSKTAPLTNKIQIINNNRNVEEGNAQNTYTNIGMQLQIPISDTINNLFDHLQIIRIAYVVAGQLPEIDIIKDIKLPGTNENFDIVDAGEDSLQELSVDEFATLNTQSIIPQVIEQNQGFMFAANVKDDSVLRVNDDDWSATAMLVGPKIGVCDEQMTALDVDKNTYLLDEDGINTQLYIEQYLQQLNVVASDQNLKDGYENPIVSSLFRSLARGETYTYGIVFYDKFGRKSDVLFLEDVNVPEEKDLHSWEYGTTRLYNWPIGVKFEITKKPNWAVGYEIVQKQKSVFEFKYLLQCALSRPLQQTLYSTNTTSQDIQTSPYYPNFLITTNYCDVTHNWYTNDENNQNLIGYSCSNLENSTLFQVFSPEILYKRNDLLTNLQHSNISISCKYYVSDHFNDIANIKKTKYYSQKLNETTIERPTGATLPLTAVQFYLSSEILYYEYPREYVKSGVFQIRPHLSGFLKNNKSSDSHVIRLLNYVELDDLSCYGHDTDYGDFNTNTTVVSTNANVAINKIKDVKNPSWHDGFTDIQNNSSNSRISSGVKAYKSFTTPFGKEYLNWICNGMYDLPIYEDEAVNTFAEGDTERSRKKYRVFTDTELDYYDRRENSNNDEKTDVVRGWIGPGPVCFVIETEENTDDKHILNLQHVYNNEGTILPGTLIANIVNTQQQIDSDKQYYTYFGQGNYYKCGAQSPNTSYTAIVFDGDRYILPCEFVSLFKAYDFKSIDDTLDSSQVVYYIPLESKVNTFFDYGMNYRNTSSKNLMLEPGSITGIATQDRPLHQYNPIYSDNTVSISIYTAQPLEERTNKFPQRICYSQHKDNGEQIDSWNIFKPVDYIDADTRYGEVTNLLSANDTIFFWQDRAFGKLSVNERSLITDNNSNTIQLGQGGVLQRTDYLSTRYGMRPGDYSAINTENGLFWIDILNKAVVANTQNGVTNYGEMLNVQNLINKNITTGVPEIDYDLQNSELLCKCFGDNQLIFNTKYNIATAIYSRSYDKMLYFNNVLYGLNKTIKYRQFNYLTTGCSELLSPTVLQFVVNNSPSQTKVFDNQKIVVANKDHATAYTQQLEFKTELNTSNVGLGWLLDTPLPLRIHVTDREQNICYAIPRDNGTDGKLIGDNNMRMRGKWMTVKITDNDPKQDFAISHIITKFRQSYS